MGTSREYESSQAPVEMQPPVFSNATRRMSRWMLLAAILIAAPAGCRGRAQRDLYQAKMAHEIRVLEDQLYEADYHNRVLIDKLEALRLKSAPRSQSPGVGTYEPSPGTVPSQGSPRFNPSIPEPIRDPIPNGDIPNGDTAPNGDAAAAVPQMPVPPELPDLPIGPVPVPSTDEVTTPRAGDAGNTSPAAPKSLDQIGDIDSIVDEGQRVSPSEITLPAMPAENAAPENPAPEESTSRDPADTPGDELLPAPGGPEPPSRRDTEIPPILPGEVLPPSILDGKEDDKPPGQIELPDAVQQGIGIPKQLRLHPTLSGGLEVDGRIEQMVVVVNVLDASGRTLDLSQYQVDADLSVAMFEPDRDVSDESRIGRWDFSSAQVRELVKSEPISGLHIPTPWQERQPAGREVIVHVRLRSEGDEMRCEGRIKLQRANAVAEWTPRGSALK